MRQIIDIGASPFDPTADTLRAGGQKVNDNFEELYARYNELVTIGEIERVGNDFTVPAGTQALIGGLLYTEDSEFDFTIEDATDGFERIDTLVFRANGFELITGTESDDIVSPPEITDPAGAVVVKSYYVNGDTIDGSPEPVTGNDNVLKSELGIAEVSTTAFPTFSMNGGLGGLRFTGSGNALFESLFIYNFSKLYPGKRLLVINSQSISLTIAHMTGIGDFKFYFGNEEDYVLAPGESCEFSLKGALVGSTVYEFIGKVSDISQSDLDAAMATKQNSLSSGVNIKTILGLNILGAGNLDIMKQIFGGIFGNQVYLALGQPGALLNAMGAPMTNLGTNDPSGSGPAYGGNSFAKMMRTRQVSAATAGSSAGHVQGSHRIFDNDLNTAYFCSVRFGNEDAATVAQARLSVGFGNDPGNTNPSTQTNIFCLGNDSGDTNLQIIHHLTAGTASKIDLGSSFPANTNSLDNYQFTYWKEKGSTAINYWVYNYHNQQTTFGTVTTDLPAVGGYYVFIRRNNGSTALAVRMSTNHHFLNFNQY